MEILHLFFNKKISTQIGIIIVLFFALLVGGFLIWQCKIMPEYGIPLIRFLLEKEKIVKGQVLENNLGCEVDAPCYLRLRVNGKEMTVVYHYGEWPPCENNEAANQGLLLKEGDEVEVFGKVTTEDEISTCESVEYYIRRVDSEQVTITTDKTEYSHGETIKVSIRNNLDKSIWYVDFTQQDLRFWDIEKFEDNRWRKLEYAKGESFRLPIEEGGKEVCYIVLYEIGVGQVAELKPSSELSYRWNQKICLLDSKKQPFEPVLLPKGRYRFTFTYGLDKSSDEPEMLMDNKTIYSNEFRIKE